MKNPFKKFGTALKIGYSVLQKVEGLQAAGILPEFAIKGVPIHVIDAAARTLVTELKKSHEDSEAPTGWSVNQ